jgi:hypothetical protein
VENTPPKQALELGLSVHQMAGILRDRARELYQIPDGFRLLTGLAIGYVGNPNSLPEAYKERELGPRQRKSLAEFVFRRNTALTVGSNFRFPTCRRARGLAEARNALAVISMVNFI